MESVLSAASNTQSAVPVSLRLASGVLLLSPVCLMTK